VQTFLFRVVFRVQLRWHIMRVEIICRNPKDDRVLPRFARYLADVNGWDLRARPSSTADIIWLCGYFEVQMFNGWPTVPIISYFTHREPRKADLFDEVAEKVQFRVTTAKMYADYLEQFGPTALIKAPVERDRFTIPPRNEKMVAGFCGYTYTTGRKGEDLATPLVESTSGIEWKASGRGWPIRTKRYRWKDMPGYLQSLDVLVSTSLIEGVPMPPLESLSCGVSNVVPRDVGLINQLPDIPGIHKYDCGDIDSLKEAFNEAVEMRSSVDRQALRDVTEEYTVENWCEGNRMAITASMDAGIGNYGLEAVKRDVNYPEEVDRGTGRDRGIFIVAFGGPSRLCAKKLMETIKDHTDYLIALCSDRPLGLEDVLITEDDSDIGGRRAKLKIYGLAPAEWKYVLYLDADTEVMSGDVNFLFKLVEDGFEFVICKDPVHFESMHMFKRVNNSPEVKHTEDLLGGLDQLQLNGGVWVFRRNDNTKRFFHRWLEEWEKYGKKDQGALIRALYIDPLKIYNLGNEWNYFDKYSTDVNVKPVIKHYPGRARRWSGWIKGRLDEKEAWDNAKKYLRQWEARGQRHRR